MCLPPGIEPATSYFPARRSNHSAIETVNDLLLKLLPFYATINQHVWQCKYEIDYGLVWSYKVL